LRNLEFSSAAHFDRIINLNQTLPVETLTCPDAIVYAPYVYLGGFVRLQCLCIDGFTVSLPMHQHRDEMARNHNLYSLFTNVPPSLERDSIRGLKYEPNFSSMPIPSDPRFVQRVLIKLVRTTPSLRWFRSDLTPENVAMLQEERKRQNEHLREELPEVEFTS
jgi:hypothetical protein